MTSHLLRKYFCKGSSVLKQHFSGCHSLWNQVTLSPYKGAHLRKKACSGNKGETGQMSLDQTECSVKYEASPALNGASKTQSIETNLSQLNRVSVSFSGWRGSPFGSHWVTFSDNFVYLLPIESETMSYPGFNQGTAPFYAKPSYVNGVHVLKSVLYTIPMKSGNNLWKVTNLGDGFRAELSSTFKM